MNFFTLLATLIEINVKFLVLHTLTSYFLTYPSFHTITIPFFIPLHSFPVCSFSSAQKSLNCCTLDTHLVCTCVGFREAITFDPPGRGGGGSGRAINHESCKSSTRQLSYSKQQPQQQLEGAASSQSAIYNQQLHAQATATTIQSAGAVSSQSAIQYTV